ncbi:hypothetical protein N7465_004894 [Penicillium sp. CMV-2018d]|nr:hypothetical protein N7465_004894 [Penicillium sp. CMV-2018d]
MTSWTLRVIPWGMKRSAHSSSAAREAVTTHVLDVSAKSKPSNISTFPAHINWGRGIDYPNLTRFHEFLPSIQKVPEYLQSTNYRNPDDPICIYMALLEPELIGFRKRFPDAPGKLVMEDLSSVIDEARDALDLEAASIDTVAHDFFAEVQPIKGARAYYFMNVLHDWSDEKATVIFNHLKPAMKQGFSKVIMEYILPDKNARSLPCMTDIAVMVFCSELESTRQRWSDLLTSVGLRVLKFWVREGDGLGIIEAELAEGS